MFDQFRLPVHTVVPSMTANLLCSSEGAAPRMSYSTEMPAASRD